MARIAEASVEDIRDRTDIVELVREYVPGLKAAGRNHKACCPFHQEKTPSFMVNPERQIFHCFGCQTGGDVFAFVMKLEGLSFPEAVTKLGERVGVRVAPVERALSPADKDRLRVRKVLESAREYYHGLLKKLPEAAAARRYLAERGLDEETIGRFRLGFAPRAGGLLAAAGRKGYEPETLQKAGLAAQREGQGSYRDYFWARVLFPILNAKGETVGFGARLMGDGEPKYLNSPDTAVFSKGRVLYGLHDALPTLRKRRECLLLEGYMDVLAAYQFGFTNACAPLGTAVTEDHVALLKRYVDRITIVFDPDAAGAAAALRGAELALEKGLAVAIATLPEGLDPDELLHKRGVEAFKAALEAAEDLAAFKTGLLLKGRRKPLPSDVKSRIASQVLETIRRCPDEVLKSEWIRGLAERLGVDEQSLRLQLQKGAEASPARRWTRKPAPGRAPESPLPVVERDILLYVLKEPALATADERSIGDALVTESDFTDERARRIFARLREALGGPEKGGDWSTRLLDALDVRDAALVRELLLDEREALEPERVVAELVGRMRKKRRLAEIEPVVLKMVGGETPLDPDIQREYNRLLAELSGGRRGA
ncbi:MAG: DNA primase [Elusimicrobiota bacterium]